MDKELIERLAREAGMVAMPQGAEQTIYCISLRQQAAFAALIAEECARAAHEAPVDDYAHGRADAAAAIRAKFKAV